jgi:hypothetical protein
MLKRAAATNVLEVRQPMTDYTPNSCRQLPLTAKAPFVLSLGMTVNKCFNYCAKSHESKFFAVTQGRECFCSAVPLGHVLSDDACDVKCVGDPTKTCGGVANIASMYTMFDCEPPSSDELKATAAKKMEKLIDSYQVKQGESCGLSKASSIELDGAPAMAGDPRDCAVACWEAKGAEFCQGFTYDETLEKCTFHADILDGDVQQKKFLSCYFKKLSIDL